MTDVEHDHDLDPFEAAWLEGDVDAVLALAQRALKADAEDAMAHGWLGVAQY